MSVRLFIGNLPYTATEAELREHLSEVGVPTSVVLPVDRETGRPRGFGFVEMPNAEATRAMQALDGKDFGGRPLKVNEAQERARSGGGGGGGGSRGGFGGGGGGRY